MERKSLRKKIDSRIVRTKRDLWTSYGCKTYFL